MDASDANIFDFTMNIRKPKLETCCCCILVILAVFIVFLLILFFLMFYAKGMVREQYENSPESKHITGGKNESYVRKQDYSCLEADIDYDNFRKYEQSSGLRFQPIEESGFLIQRYQFQSTPFHEHWIRISNGFYCVDKTEWGITKTVYDLDNKRIYQNWVSTTSFHSN